MAIYMNYEDIKGDVSEEGHKEWIQLGSVSFHAHRDAETHVGQASQRQGSDVAIGDITVSKPLCAGSALLFLASLVGRGKKVLIHISRTGELQQSNYLQITLENCCVTDYSVNSDGAFHTESLSLNFLKIEMTHQGVKFDGSEGDNNTVGFDIPTGQAA